MAAGNHYLPVGLSVLVSLGLVAVTIYEIVTTTQLSLPIASNSIAALVLLIIAGPIQVYASRVVLSHRCEQQRGPHRLVQEGSNDDYEGGRPIGAIEAAPLRPARLTVIVILQVVQGILTTALATRLAEGVAEAGGGGPGGGCVLEAAWRRMYSAHDGDAIRRIQDRLSCCGFNTPHDRAWPFPSGRGGSGQPACSEVWGRTAACRGPWAEAMRAGAGVELGVVVVVGLFQVLSILGTAGSRYYPWRSGPAPDWAVIDRGRRGNGQARRQQQQPSRPLLAGAEAYTDGVDDDDNAAQENGHGAGESDAQERPGGHGHERGPALPAPQQQPRESNQGTGPRLEPSMLGDSRAWEAE